MAMPRLQNTNLYKKYSDQEILIKLKEKHMIVHNLCNKYYIYSAHTEKMDQSQKR